MPLFGVHPLGWPAMEFQQSEHPKAKRWTPNASKVPCERPHRSDVKLTHGVARHPCHDLVASWSWESVHMANYIPIEILVADDSFEDVLFLSLAFRRAKINHSLSRVANGQEAIDYPRDKPPPDMLLLDLKMPGKDGFEVLEWIRSQPALAN